MRKSLLKSFGPFLFRLFLLPVFVSVAILLSPALSAQTFVQAPITGSIAITGQVQDSNGLPVAGAVVLDANSKSNGTVTDAKGNFTLKVSSANASLDISYIGMESTTVPLNGRNAIVIILKEDTKLIDDVVVIGYGTVRKSDLTGSVATVGERVFSEKMNLSMEDALRGQVAGVRISSTDGEPGAEFNIRIRGAGSINATNSPLYVIDGLPMEASDINPNDIQSMEILKDASATAIYGSQGANGVVIITTKQGEKGKTKITFNTKLALQKPVNLIEMMNSEEYTKTIWYQTWISAGNYYPYGLGLPTGNNDKTYLRDEEGGIYTQTTGHVWYKRIAVMSDPTNPDYIYTDWQDLMLRDTWLNDYNLNISGGTEQSSFSLIGNYFKQPGIIIKTGTEKYSLRFNYKTQLTRKVTLGLMVNGSRSFQEGTSSKVSDGVIMNMLAQPPVKRWSEMEFEAVEGETQLYNNNPYYQAHNIINTSSVAGLNARLFFDIMLSNAFKFTTTANYVYRDSKTQRFVPKSVNSGYKQKGRANYNTGGAENFTNENLLYYTPGKFGNFKIDAMVGAIFSQNTSIHLNTQAQNFAMEELKYEAMDLAAIFANIASSKNITRMASFMGRANINHNERYLLTGSLRADGSSRFGADNKWAYFPSAAFAWRVSEEPFLKKNHTISNLKLRLSLGTSGNTGIPALQSLDAMSPIKYPMDGTSSSLGLGADRSINPDLKWETSTQYDGGIDLDLFKNRISVVVDAYYKQTRDLLFNQPVPSATGYTNRWSNIGAVDNKGLEITVSGNVLKTGSFRWQANFNTSFNRSKVISLGDASFMILDPGNSGPFSNFAMLKVGMPLGQWYGYQTNGLWRKQSEIDALPDDYSQHGITKSQLQPGDVKFVDQDPNGVIDDGDRIILGCGEPKFTGGWHNTFTYKNISLNLGLEFKYGGKNFNATSANLTQFRGRNNNLKSVYGKYFLPNLYDMNNEGELVFPGYVTGNIKRPNGWDDYFASTLWIEDASYLRLSDVTLRYEIPKKLINRFGMQSFSVFCSVKNAWIFTKYTGYDPDISVANGIYSDLVPGLDYAAYPKMRAFTLGLSLTFR